MSETTIAMVATRTGSATRAARQIPFAHSAMRVQTKEEIRLLIESIGVIPSIRVTSIADALFAAEAVARAGVPVLEISAAAPGAAGVISELVKHAPGMIVGAGGISSANAARQCLDQGARFLSSYGLLPEMAEFSAREDVLVIPGALTPTEIMAAWNAGSDFVKVYPCGLAGGHRYIRSLKAALPEVRLIAAGGVNQLTAFELVVAGAAALSVGSELFPEEAVWLREGQRVQELARRFLGFVEKARAKSQPES